MSGSTTSSWPRSPEGGFRAADPASQTTVRTTRPARPASSAGFDSVMIDASSTSATTRMSTSSAGSSPRAAATASGSEPRSADPGRGAEIAERKTTVEGAGLRPRYRHRLSWPFRSSLLVGGGPVDPLVRAISGRCAYRSCFRGGTSVPAATVRAVVARIAKVNIDAAVGAPSDAMTEACAASTRRRATRAPLLTRNCRSGGGRKLRFSVPGRAGTYEHVAGRARPGLPGVSKTTLARERARVPHQCQVLNRDEMRDALFPDRFRDYGAERTGGDRGALWRCSTTPVLFYLVASDRRRQAVPRGAEIAAAPQPRRRGGRRSLWSSCGRRSRRGQALAPRRSLGPQQRPPGSQRPPPASAGLRPDQGAGFPARHDRPGGDAGRRLPASSPRAAKTPPAKRPASLWIAVRLILRAVRPLAHRRAVVAPVQVSPALPWPRPWTPLSGIGPDEFAACRPT